MACRFTINKAMTNATGIAHFSRNCTSEQCALDIKAEANYDLIDTTTVDNFISQNEIDFVDILKVHLRIALVFVACFVSMLLLKCTCVEMDVLGGF